MSDQRSTATVNPVAATSHRVNVVRDVKIRIRLTAPSHLDLNLHPRDARVLLEQLRAVVIELTEILEEDD